MNEEKASSPVRQETPGGPEELNRLAYVGAPAPEGLSYAERVYFTELRAVYDLFRRGGITIEDAQREKRQILMDYNAARDWARSGDYYRELRFRLANAVCEYRGAPSIETADGILLAFDGFVGRLGVAEGETPRPDQLRYMAIQRARERQKSGAEEETETETETEEKGEPQ